MQASQAPEQDRKQGPGEHRNTQDDGAAVIASPFQMLAAKGD